MEIFPKVKTQCHITLGHFSLLLSGQLLTRSLHFFTPRSQGFDLVNIVPIQTSYSV